MNEMALNTEESLAEQLGISKLKLPLPKPTLNERLSVLINTSPIMIFIKGSPEQPKCGFSKTLLTILNDNNIEYKYFDILTDDEVRNGLKIFSDWPTYPQLYSNGVLIGGLDIIKEMIP